MGKKKATTPVGAGGGEAGSHTTTAGKKKKKKEAATAPPVPAAGSGGGEDDMFAAMSNDELVKLWEGIIDEDREAAAELFFEALARHAAAEYEKQGDLHPHARFFEPWQPSSPPKPDSPPPQTAFEVVTVLALRAPPHLSAGKPKRTAPPSTACAAAQGQGKKPRCKEMEIARRAGEEEEGQDHPRASSFPLPQEPSTKPDQVLATSPPPTSQASFKTYTVLCAPPHLARGRMGPPSTACASQGKKRRVV